MSSPDICDFGIGDGSAEVVDYTQIWKDFLNLHCKNDFEKIRREYPKTRSLYLNYSEINAFGEFGPKLADRIDATPKTVLQEIHDVIVSNRLIFPQHTDEKINVRIFNLPRKKLIRKISNDDIDHFVSIEGLVRKSTQKGSLRCLIASFRCPAGHRTRVIQTQGLLKEPDKCSADGCKFKKFEFIEKDSVFQDVQKLRIQESPEGLSGGDQPATIDIDCLDDICHIARPGDRVIITGIVRRINKSTTHIKSSGFNLYIECNSIQLAQLDSKDIKCTDTEMDEIKRLASSPDIYDLVSRSFAPAVYGYEEVKFGIVLLLFDGIPYIIGQSRKRGDIHVLITGDPGIAKSVMLNYASLLIPRSVKVSGEAASAAGLTGAAVKDDFGEGSWTIEAGAMSIADGGVCIVDEIGRMGKSDLGALHNASEGEQEVNISKAGISTTLKTRCSILAAQNPKYGRYDDTISIAENLDLKPALVSRFDLIFIIKDYPERVRDQNIANYIMDSLLEEQIVTPPIPLDLFRKYIAYARQLKPVFSVEAAALFKEYYPAIRSIATDRTKPMPMTARQLEAGIRIATALAKIQLSEIVTETHGKKAIKVLDSCLRSIAYDPGTGMFDIDAIMSGKTKGTRDICKIIIQTAKTFEEKKLFFERDLIDRVVKLGYSEIDVRKKLELLKTEGEFITPKIGKLIYQGGF